MAKPSNVTNSTINNQHKTPVDGDSTINRRRMLTMSTSLAIATVSMSAKAAFGSALLAQAYSEHPDRALFEAIAEWQSGHEEQERLWSIQCRLEDLASETEPPVPSELFEALDMPDGKRLPSNLAVGWDELSLHNLAETGKVLQTSAEKLPNEGLRTDLWWADISKSTRQRAGELLQIRLRYRDKIKAHKAEAEDAGERFADQVSKRWDMVMEIAGMSVCTGEGLAAKCQMLLDEPMFGDMTGDMGSEEGFIAKCLIDDIQKAVNCGTFTA